MSTENITPIPEEQEQSITLREIIALCLARWTWFVGSIAVCLLLGTVYLLKTQPVFTRSASVLIKEDGKKSSSIGDVSQAFSDMNLGLGRINVHNEIINFTSPDLMLEVVKRLHLETNYQMESGLFKKGHRLYNPTLYGSSLPFTVSFLDLGNNDGVRFTMEPQRDSTYRMTDFHMNGAEFDDRFQVAPGDTVNTPAGRIVIETSPYSQARFPENNILVSRSGYFSVARGYCGRLSATLQEKNSTVINLSISDVNTQRAEDVLNMLINVYNENWIKDKNSISTSTNEFIADRLRIIEQELGNVDSNISEFKSRNRIPDVRAAASMDMQLAVQAGQQITEVSNQISIARFLTSYIRESEGKLLPADAGLSEGSISNLINQYNSMLLQRNRLAENSSSENYLVKDLDLQLQSMKTAILSSLDNYVVAQNMQLQSYQSTQSALDARVVTNPQRAGELLSDERQQKVKEALYLFLLQKREENELSQAFTPYNSRVVVRPYGSGAPVAPRKMMILLVSLMLGAALPLGLIYLLEMTNTTVRGRKDLERIQAPFAGEIPGVYLHKVHLWDHLIPKKAQKDRPEERRIVVKPHSRDIINEAFRVVRTNLEFINTKNAESKTGATVIMITSMNPGSGKTFCISNLASAFAIKGRRTLAIDLDLRKKSLSIFANSPKKGVSNYLAHREEDYHPFIVKNIQGTGLDILPVGTLPPNPSELLSDDRLAQMVTQLRKEYDYIFLDCPPVEIVTDADIISRVSDITIFTVKAGLMDRAMLPEINKFYAAQRFPNLVVLLNGTNNAGRYGYHYGYRYGYRYGSSYGSHSYGYGDAYGNKAEEEDQDNGQKA